jgi:hypothetical protein
MLLNPYDTLILRIENSYLEITHPQVLSIAQRLGMFFLRYRKQCLFCRAFLLLFVFRLFALFYKKRV